jgi:hypothetical protein
LIVSLWAVIAVSIVALVLFAITKAVLFEKFIPVLLGGIIILGLAVLLLSIFVYCPHCGRRLLLRSRGERSISRAHFRRVDSWASAVVEVLVRQACYCIYCARKVAVPWRR